MENHDALHVLLFNMQIQDLTSKYTSRDIANIHWNSDKPLTCI